MNPNSSEYEKSEYEPLPPDEKEIDRLLEEMAKTAPEAPADFHDRWMNAVREEAGKQKAPVSQWPKILSVAAAFVLLIGGVILVRTNGQKQQTPDTPALPRSGEAVEEAKTAEAAEEAQDAAAPFPAAKARQEEKQANLGLPVSTNAPAEEKAVPLMAAGAAREAEPAYEAEEAEEVEEAYAANAAPEAAYSDMAADTAWDAAGAYEDPGITAWFAGAAEKLGAGILELLSAASR